MSERDLSNAEGNQLNSDSCPNQTMMSDYSMQSSNTNQQMVVEETKQQDDGDQTLTETQKSSVVQQISDLSDFIVNQIDAKYEPDDAIKSMNALIELQLPKIKEEISTNKDEKVRLYKKVFKTVADKMLCEKLIQNVGVSFLSY